MSIKTFELDPMMVPAIAAIMDAIKGLAKIYIESCHEHQSLNEFAEQCAAKTGYEFIAIEIKHEVRRCLRKARLKK